MKSRSFRLLVVLIATFSMSIAGGFAQEPATEKSECRHDMSAISESDASEQPIVVSMNELRRHPEKYYGKTVTVDGEMHRIFTDNVFTIEDSGFFRDHDVLIISTAPRSEVVVSLEKSKSIAKGKDVRVTGVVQPYDRGKLECAYGPLHLESREGHSFTKSPVLIIDTTLTAKTQAPAQAETTPPEPVEPPAQVEPPAPEIAVVEPVAPPMPEPAPPAEALPRTAGNLPLLALTGLLALCGAFIKRH